MVENRYKYEQPSRIEPRPTTFPKAKVEVKTLSQRNLTDIAPTKPGPDEPKPRARPKQADVKPKAVQLEKSHVEATIPPVAKVQDETQSQEAGTPKTVAPGPSSDGNTISTEGYYELSPLMSRMLNTELEDIMIKVWQELPDNPTNEAEKLVVNRLRNQADDDLRNVFGLNVSKRLLNVFSVMYIKMKFTLKPDGQELTKFLKRNNITNFKWNNLKPLTYTGIVRNVKDFDRLCATQKFRIGNTKVIITPLYQFTKCPPKLRTSYHVSNFRSMNVSTNISNGNPTESAKTTEQNNTATETAKATKELAVENPPSDVTKETVKADKTTEAKDITKDINVKTTPNVGKQSKITPEKKPNTKPSAEKQKITTAKKIEVSGVVKKEPVKKKTIEKKPKPSGRSILEAGNDFDELNDDEIMALVSQGIVLDECSGSDVDM